MALTKPLIDGRELDAVQRVLESGWLTEGPVTAELERKVASYVGSKYAIVVCNCTVALTLCLKAYKVTGEVLIPDFTHPATAQAVINAGAHPILSDVDLDTHNISLSGHSWADATIPVSWGGNPEWCVPYDTLIVEDGACSLGSEFEETKTGSKYTTCFSFHPRKVITCGEGGVITTNDEKIMRRLRSLKNFGESSDVLLSQKWDGNYDYQRWCKGKVDFNGNGTNAKISDILSAICLVQMNKIDEIINKRVEMARVYTELLDDVRGVVVPSVHPNAKHTFQTYAVRLEKGDRDKCISKLAEKGIETQIGTYALHLLSRFKKLKRIGPLTNSTRLYHNLLALPMAYDLSEEDQQFVVEALKREIA